MRTRPVLTRALGTLAMALAASACFGGGGRLSKSVYVDKASAICRQANKKISALPHPDLAVAEATPSVIRRVVAIQRDEISQLDDLRPPEIDEPAIKQWLRAARKALDASEAALTALEHGDVNGINSSTARGNDANAKADELARGYGITACATKPTSTAGQGRPSGGQPGGNPTTPTAG